MEFKISKKKSRYIITDNEWKILDDAQWYGYTSKEKALKAWWYKFSWGKQKINDKQYEVRKWKRENNEKYMIIKDYILDICFRIQKSWETDLSEINTYCKENKVPDFIKKHILWK